MAIIGSPMSGAIRTVLTRLASLRGRTITTARCTPLLVVAMVLSGCSVWQLRHNTVDVGGSVGSIYTAEVIENLNQLDQNSNAVPSLYALASGQIHTMNSGGPDFSFPLGNSVTRTAITDGVSQIVSPYRSFTLQGTEQWDQQWNITPENSPIVLQALRAIYLYALAKPEAAVAVRDATISLANLDQQAGAGKKPPSGEAATTTASSRNAPTATVSPPVPTATVTPKWLDLFNAAINDIKKKCDTGSGCFSFKAKPSCRSPNDATLVCVGSAGDLLERATGERELTLPRKAYQDGVLFDLVAFSLEFQDKAAISTGSGKTGS